MMIVIVLGFCVFVCLCDLVINIGGMNYFLLFSEDMVFVGNLNVLVCYGFFVMELLINEFLKLGVLKSCLEVKVFGGGNVL